ncbi:MAG: helix-turn-helix transcriptional regulator, partial [Anaerocolumna sp.]
LCRKGCVDLDIGKKIRFLRLQKNIPQNDLAQIIGVSKSTMSNYERNYSTPDPDILVKLADYFNVSIDYLFDYGENHETELAKESSNYNHPDPAVLSKDEWNVLNYYNRLQDENKDYIKGQMIQLFLKQTNLMKDDNSN